MSLTAACGWTCLRSVLLALVSLPITFLLSEVLKSSNGITRRLIWIGLLAPFVAPELLVGYGYSSFSLSLVHHRGWNELLYGLLIACKFIPVGTIVIYFAPPPPLSAEARYLRRLALGAESGIGRRIRIWLESIVLGPGRAALAACALLFLLAFQEFEMASLMGTVSWTKWLFDVQAGGLMLSQTWNYATVPLVWEAAILLPALLLVLGTRYSPSTPDSGGRTVASGLRIAAYGYLAVAMIAVCIVPGAIVIRHVAAGFGLLGRDMNLRNELLAEIARSGVLAIVSGLAAFGITRMIVGIRSRWFTRRTQVAAGVVFSVLGLLGPLVLGLSVLHLFQNPALRRLYDTPLALLLAFMLLLVPRAFLLQLVLKTLESDAATHLGRLLMNSPLAPQRAAAHELNWDLKLRGCFWGTALLCYWAYLDLTISSLLAPTGMVCAPVRLYNLMHYGQSAVLSAMLLTTIAAPLLLVSLITAARRPLWRWICR